MKPSAKAVIYAKNQSINIYTPNFREEFISLTDIARYRSDEPNDVIRNWMRNRETLEFLGLWESLHNPAFKPVEFDGFRQQAGLHAFTMSPKKWIDGVNAIGITVKPGRYHGGTYAQPDIAFEFASWVSAEFKLYIIKEYQKLKKDANNQLSLSWNLKREISKINYRFHTKAIQDHLIPPALTPKQVNHTYANEADLLNVAVFGQTAKEWRTKNPHKTGNIRDDASYEQLLVLSNLESYNSAMIKDGLTRQERLVKLHDLASEQLRILSEYHVPNRLEG